MRVLKLLTGFIVSCMVAWPSPANAQSTIPALRDSPAWVKNVSREKQEASERLLKAGNEKMRAYAYSEAEQDYRQALKYWDHPGAHYNLALALMNLDRPLEVHKHIVQALSYGEAPLGPQKYAHARQYKELIEKQLAWVEISCETPGAIVTVSGERLPLVDGRYEGLMRPGAATLVATKPGYLLREKKLALSPGKNSVRVRLYTSDDLIRYEPRWAPWKPWAVMGAGAALTAGGGGLFLKTRGDSRAFDRHVRDCAEGTEDRGCREEGLSSRRHRLDRLNRVSIGTMAAGGAVLTTGAVLMFLNRSQSYSIDPDKYEQEQGWVVTPLLGRDSNGVLATLQF